MNPWVFQAFGDELRKIATGAGGMPSLSAGVRNKAPSVGVGTNPGRILKGNVRGVKPPTVGLPTPKV